VWVGTEIGELKDKTMPFTFKLSKRLSLMKASLALAAAAPAACELGARFTDPTLPGSPVVQVVTVPDTLTLDPHQTRQFVAYGRTHAGDSVAVIVTWSSSNTRVATVSSSGLVTGVTAGSVTITATGEEKSGNAAVTVKPVSVASVSISPASAAIPVGQTLQLTATAFDADGNPLSGRAVTWASSDPAVASVSGSGLVLGLVAGSATITATSEGQSGTLEVSVKDVPVALVTVSPASASILLGTTRQLSAVTKDAAGNTLIGRSVTWSSGTPAVAAVSSTGVVTGLAAGAVTITATSEGVRGTAAVTIAAASTHIGSPDLEPGLLGRTDLVLFEDFEYADWLNHWSGGYVVDPATLSRATSPVFQGNQGLEVRVPNGSHYGVELDFAFGKKGLAEPDEIYLRYYVRFNDTWQKTGDGQLGKFPGFSGTYNRCGWGSGVPDGTCWSARMASYDVGAGNQVGFYTYHMDQGSIYGDIMLWQPTLARGQWYCVEAHVKLNSLSGGAANYDGVLRGWIDGAPAFERTNLRFRTVSSTHVEKIWWNIYIGGTWTADRDMAIHYDNVVIAKQPIGCYSPPTP